MKRKSMDDIMKTFENLKKFEEMMELGNPPDEILKGSEGEGQNPFALFSQLHKEG